MEIQDLSQCRSHGFGTEIQFLDRIPGMRLGVPVLLYMKVRDHRDQVCRVHRRSRCICQQFSHSFHYRRHLSGALPKLADINRLLAFLPFIRDLN